MNNIDLRLALQCGTPVPVPECQLVLVQPTLSTLASMGERNFFKALQLLTIEKKSVIQDEKASSDISNFQIFMTAISNKEMAEGKESVLDLMGMMLPEYKISLLPRSIAIMKGQEVLALDESNFDSFQRAIKVIYNVGNKKSDLPTYNPGNERAKEIAKKLMRGRALAAAAHENENTGVLSREMSCLAIGAHIPLSESKNYTVFQLFDLIERYDLWMRWDIDLRAKLQGASSDTKVENWMKQLH